MNLLGLSYTTSLSSVSAADDRGDGFYLTPGVDRFEDAPDRDLSMLAVEIVLD